MSPQKAQIRTPIEDQIPKTSPTNLISHEPPREFCIDSELHTHMSKDICWYICIYGLQVHFESIAKLLQE
jgi:hypothetical protein